MTNVSPGKGSRVFCLLTSICIAMIFQRIAFASQDNLATRVRPQSEPLNVSVNQTIVLDFTMPIKRAGMANEEIASVSVLSPKSVMVVGKTFGFTQLLLWNEDGSQMLYDIRVDVDMNRLQETISDSEPRAKVKISTLLDTVVLTGNVPDGPTAERITDLAKIFSPKVQNQLTIAGTQQVLLRTTVAEVSRQATKALGINATVFGNDAFGGSNIGNINPTSIGLADQTLVPLQTPNLFQTVGDIAVRSGTTMYLGLPYTQMEIVLQAMQENSLIKVLAEPKLVAISGQEAEFLAGGELPIPTPNENGIAITFREYGVRLKFKPVVQAGQMIRMNVTSEVSEPDYTNAVQIEGYIVPGLNKRMATTIVEIGAGQTFAIAGLLSEGVRGISNKVPGVGDIPVLGALFRSVNFERSKTELMIFITPDLASPLNAGEATYIPGKDIQGPSDWELYGKGLIESQEGIDQETASEDAIVNCDEDSIFDGNTNQPSFCAPAPLYGPWGIQKATDSN